MIRIELTPAILMPRLPDFGKNRQSIFSHIFIVIEEHPVCRGFDAMPITIKQYQIYMSQFIPILFVNGDSIVRACDCHSNETVNIRKHVTKHKNTRKWMVEFRRKSECRGIKIELTQFPKPNLLFCINFVRC